MANRLPREIAEAKSKAKFEGQSQYQGRPCRLGHDGRRYVSGNACVTCAQNRTLDQYHDNRDKRKRWEAANREKVLWNNAYYRAKRKGLEFAIDVSDIKIPETCPVLGIPMDCPSLDRIRNEDGYTLDNICVISKRANTLKNNATVEELEAVIAYMRRI